MSLLIKALQKAEQGNKRPEDKPGLPATDLELEPMHPEHPAQEAIQSNTPLARDEPKHVSQQSAAAMFKAKSVQPANAASKRAWLFIGIGLILLLCIAAGFYSYLQSLQQPVLAPIKPLPPLVSVTPEPPVAVASTEQTPPVAEADAATPVPAEKMPDIPVAAATVAASNDVAKPGEVASQPPRRSPPASQQLAFGEPVASVEDNPVKITRIAPNAGINPTVLSAYQAFMAGNDAAAQTLYWQVLRSDVRNIDALLGMAAIAARQQRKDDAAGWYGKVLEVEPRNTVAQAGMIALLSGADPITNESRIKNLLAQKPQSAHLHAALGNHYAGQNQWPAAQQAYFDAYHFDSDNAEYAFNLAISLDHLGKSSLALKYYKESQVLLADSAATNIDRAQLESRIAQLQ